MVVSLPDINIGNLHAEHAIIQGGMGVGISLSNLASAVAEQGGIGVISSVGLGLIHPEMGRNFHEANLNALRNEIRTARKQTNGVLGVNVMVAVSDYDDLVSVALEEKIDILFLGAGLPLKPPSLVSRNDLRRVETKIAVIVSSERAARIVLNTWDRKFSRVPDAFVVEGPKAGGHLGFKREQIDDSSFSLERILPGIIHVANEYSAKYRREIPVIAAGGIFNGKDILDIMSQGAQGVQMGTRFIATDECDASATFKDQFIRCESKDIVIIDSPVGLPGRAIGNSFLEQVSCGQKKPFNCPWKCLKSCDFHHAPYCIAQALKNAREGLFDDGFAFSGAKAYLLDRIVSVKELFSNLANEYQNAFIDRELATNSSTSI